jgi:hypothetical protein
MVKSFSPRLSEARHFLPLLRRYLVGAACRYPLPTGLTIDLLPIVEDGVFGYELIPDRDTHTYLTIGCDAQREPVMRRTLYGVGASDTLRLVTVNGRVLSRTERAARYNVRQHDVHFDDWPEAAEAAWSQLASIFPGRPRQPVVLAENFHRCLDQALSIAYSHLIHWNPSIRFCGIPNEAEQGFLLSGVDDQHGELVFQRPDIWMLRWKAPPHAVYESWSVALPEQDGASDPVRDDRAS